MALFESYERRINNINAVLNANGIASIEEAKKILAEARKEKLPIVDDEGNLTGLITIKGNLLCTKHEIEWHLMWILLKHSEIIKLSNCMCYGFRGHRRKKVLKL